MQPESSGVLYDSRSGECFRQKIVEMFGRITYPDIFFWIGGRRGFFDNGSAYNIALNPFKSSVVTAQCCGAKFVIRLFNCFGNFMGEVYEMPGVECVCKNPRPKVVAEACGAEWL